MKDFIRKKAPYQQMLDDALKDDPPRGKQKLERDQNTPIKKVCIIFYYYPGAKMDEDWVNMLLRGIKELY